jgi:hypothetical protein
VRVDTVDHSWCDPASADAKGTVKIRITVPTQNGWKAIAFANGARQELFVSTAIGEAELAALIQEAIRLAS